MWQLKKAMFKQVSIAFLIYFRFFAGLLIGLEVFVQFFSEDFENYYNTIFHFTYLIFPFQILLTKWQAASLMMVITISGLLVAVGWRYKFSSLVLFLSHGLFFLIEKAEYVNHFYLYVLITFILLFIPAADAVSFDSKRKGVERKTVDAWIYYILLIQISIVYLFAGIAKLHFDWFEARALKIWLPYLGDELIFGDVLKTSWAPYAWAYGGLLFDLLVVPGMLWRKTRVFTFTLACIFHLTNVLVFGLATFPWFSIMMTLLFFGPEFPAQLPILKKLIAQQENIEEVQTKELRFVHYMFMGYLLLQLTIPFRHFLYPGSPNWTEEGHRYAWHMMLRTKSANTRFNVHYDNQIISLNGKEFLTNLQLSKMSGDPDLILEFSHFLGQYYRDKGYDSVKVFVTSLVGLNGRPPQLFIDDHRNLLEETRSVLHYDWVIPLKD